MINLARHFKIEQWRREIPFDRQMAAELNSKRHSVIYLFFPAGFYLFQLRLLFVFDFWNAFAMVAKTFFEKNSPQSSGHVCPGRNSKLEE